MRGGDGSARGRVRFSPAPPFAENQGLTGAATLVELATSASFYVARRPIPVTPKAARLLDDPGRTIEQVALKLDFPSGAALRNMFKRYTGLRTTEVRENGGVRCLVHTFKRELAAVSAGKPPVG